MNRKWFLAEVPETQLKEGGKGPPPKSSVTMEIRWVPYIHPHDLNKSPQAPPAQQGSAQ